MLKIVPSNQFKKDLKLARKRGCKIERLRDVVNVLANGQKLDEKHHDHGLAGNYNGFRECHVEPDWLLIYRIHQDALELFLFRTGTHSDLF
ncbi:MAG: type II toxin-antitoxin system YafQ family toxin [Clostridium sp.]|nr:type II toxin-antitoxin system YafQ family toxin [Clostridium sp.]